MRYFIDTEFTNDDPALLQLISVGIVADDGREYYAISSDFDPATIQAWVAENVMPLLEPRDHEAWRPRGTIARDLTAFIVGDGAEIWGMSPGYDWYLVHGLFGGWSKIPESMPWNCWDLKQWAWQLGVTDLPAQQTPVHHALNDARHDKDVFDHLAAVARSRGLPTPAP